MIFCKNIYHYNFFFSHGNLNICSYGYPTATFYLYDLLLVDLFSYEFTNRDHTKCIKSLYIVTSLLWYIISIYRSLGYFVRRLVESTAFVISVVNIFALHVVDHRFEPQSGHIKACKIDICCSLLGTGH